MKVDIKIPTLGESISEVVIGSILKSSGSQVLQDDEILELETDKLNQVLYAPQSGIVHINVKQGDKAKVGDVIGFVDVQEESLDASTKQIPEEAAKEEPKKPVSKATSPASISKKEWLDELEEKVKEPALQNKEINQEQRKPLSALRKAMGKHLLEAAHTTVMLTTFNEVDMSEVIKLRELYKEAFFERYKTKLGFMSFFVKAAVSALQVYPQVNSYLEGDTQVFHASVNIGVAVSSERGLVVPVLHNVNAMSFANIEQSIDEYALKAKNGTLKPADLKGGGFTVTNGGLFGSMLSTPILNPPQCAILGMHKITKRAVVIGEQIVIRPIMYLALSYDHRVLDGKEAVSFLVHIKNMIEDPHRLELGV